MKYEEIIEDAKYTIPQQILGNLEHGGFYDAGKYLDDDIFEPIEEFLKSTLTKRDEAIRKMIEGMKPPLFPIEDESNEKLLSLQEGAIIGYQQAKADLLAKLSEE